MFFKRKKKQTNKGQELENRAVQWVARLIIVVQVRWSDFMNRQFSKLSPKAQLTMLVLLVVIVAPYCTVLVAGLGGQMNLNNKKQMAIHLPKVITKEKGISAPSVNDPAFQRIMAFRHYLDSLRQTEKGRLKFDSINRARPGLVDSIAQVEAFYNSK